MKRLQQSTVFKEHLMWSLCDGNVKLKVTFTLHVSLK